MQSQLEDHQTRYTDLPFDLHVGDLDNLWADARRETVPRHLVITATDLHQRNIEDRLRRQQRPQSNFRFVRIGELAGDITRPSPAVSTAMDRVDRLMLIREVIASTDDPVYDYLAAVLGRPLEKHIERIERTRSEFELVTGFHPTRMDAFASIIEEQRASAREDTLDLLAGVSKLQNDLQRRLTDGENPQPTQAVSKTSLLCRALGVLGDDPSVWTSVYSDIETLSVTGTSMLTAPIEDLCRLVSQTTDVDVHLHLREVSGPQIGRQLSPQSDIETFGSQGVFEWR